MQFKTYQLKYAILHFVCAFFSSVCIQFKNVIIPILNYSKTLNLNSLIAFVLIFISFFVFFFCLLFSYITATIILCFLIQFAFKWNDQPFVLCVFGNLYILEFEYIELWSMLRFSIRKVVDSCLFVDWIRCVYLHLQFRVVLKIKFKNLLFFFAEKSIK